MFRENIADAIRDKRPHLSDTSLRTYVSTLFNLHRRLGGNEDLDWFKTHVDDILHDLRDTPARARKSVLSACFVLTEEPKFREQMIEDCNTTHQNYLNQSKDDRERENWVSMEEIQQKYEMLKNQVEAMFSHKILPKQANIVEFFLLAFLGGAMPPRRSVDYGLLKIRHFDTAKDNYYQKGKFFFHQYKTAGRYGLQSVDVPVLLQTLIKKWMKVNPSDYMLLSSNGKPLTSPQVSRILNKVFSPQKVSTDILRHSYLTNVFKDSPAIREMESLAAAMGHSVATQAMYVKKS